ncbi:MAG: EamA family transporter [Opitutus sp.]
MPLSHLLPLVSAIAYAIAALLVKRAADLGVGVWRTAFIANVVGALLFQPILLLGGKLHPELWYQPVALGACFVVAQWLSFASFDRGDVSVATPVLGIKILLVAIFVTLLGGAALGWRLWLGAVLATAGIGLLNQRASAAPHHAVGRTIVTAGLAAAAYAIFDTLLQRWSPAWDLGRLLPLTMAVSGLLSFGFIRMFHAPLSAISKPAWRWLLSGAFLMGLNSIVFIATIAHWGNATIANVLYSSRGLWTVVLVSSLGHLVNSREQHLGRKILISRFAGGALMMSAIVLVLM